MALDPALASVRLAVRRSLSILTERGGEVWAPDLGDTVLVACSGGADSLALLAATVFEAHRIPVRVVGVTVDHGLQDGSAGHTERVVAQMAGLGVDETASVRVTVDSGPAGTEAGAREARYAALSQLAEHFGAEMVLLGHTLDDQAETVLLGLARGSGGRSLMGMRRGFRRDEGPSSFYEYNRREVETPDGVQIERLGSPRPRRSTLFLRPLLDLTRATTEAACRADGITWWEDPHNSDPRFTRARVRHTVMPLLERELGPGVRQALARTADLLREDVTSLDERAEAVLQDVGVGDGLDTSALEALDPATTHRVVRMACIEAGAIPSELTRDHVLAVADILLGARDPRQIQLPGHVTAYRDGTLLRFRRT
ncbi:MAG TPA: tRNA lysidine(34) synthetase TilS [Marmoricola sp.]|nr:tRNA lysidine(34) synthetase TilS [Marmoricola sp.]